MKKISSPSPNNFVPKEVPVNPTDITIEDIKMLKKQLDDAGIKDRFDGKIDVTSISKSHYKLTGKHISMVVRKDILEDALKKAAGITFK